MNLYVALLHVAAILSIAGSTLGDADGGCPITEGSEPKTVNDMFKDGLDECFGQVGGLDLEVLKKEMQPEIMSLTVFKEFCRREETIKNCLSTITTRYSACLNETQQNPFVLLEDVLKTGFGYSCFETSEYLFSVMEKVFSHDTNSTAEHNDITDCLATAQANELEGNNPDTSNSMLGFYHRFKVFRQCFMSRIRGVNPAVNGAQMMLSGISKSIKCPHPDDDGNLVLCETLDPTPYPEDTVCPFTNINDAKEIKLSIFLGLATQCLVVNLNQLDPGNLRGFTSLGEYQTFFNTSCQNKPHVLNCLSVVSSNSRVCQNEPNHQVLELFTDFLESTVEISCKEDGAKLATIFNGLISSADRAVDNDTIRLCSDASRDEYNRGVDASDSLSSKTTVAYAYAVSLTQCLLDGSTDNSFKTVFASFTNECLGAAKCVNPADGTTALCGPLVNSFHT